MLPGESEGIIGYKGVCLCGGIRFSVYVDTERPHKDSESWNHPL